MSDYTRAVVIPEPGKVELQQVALRTPGPNDVVVKTAYTSISAGTERMLLAGQMPHPMLQLPVVPGYETVGQVVEVGADVDVTWNGRWVYIGGAHCYEAVNPAWGGQSARLFTDVSRVVPLDDMEPTHGVLLALAATALHGVDLLGETASERVLVLGQGPVGQLAARFLRARGAWTAVSDLSAARLQHSVGDLVINAAETAVTDAIEEPVQVIIEATGSMKALSDALPLLANGGVILLLGYYQNLNLPYMPLFLKEARLLTAKEWAPGDLLRCRDMIAAGSLDVAPLLTHSFSVVEVATAYKVALEDKDCLKLLLHWNGEAANG